MFDTIECRNDGQIINEGVTWELNDPVPLSWQPLGEQTGVMDIDGSRAVFTSNDGVELELQSDYSAGSCNSWDPPPDPLPLQRFGELTCDEGHGLTINAAEGGPAQILREASAEVVDVDPDEDGQWWGYDASGRVVVGLFSGGAEYQLVRCTP